MANPNPLFIDEILFIVLPYLALAIFLLVSIRRYVMQSFSFSSLSSQFLENQHHFWGVVPFHYGIITLFFAHLIAFLLPEKVIVWNSIPLRLYILEIAAFIFGLLTIVGLVSVIARRLKEPKVKMVTSVADWIILVMFLIQVFSGLYTAIFHQWGSAWFAASASPYLWSILTLNPNISYITAMPFMVKFHIVGAYTMIAFFPFTRLVHALVIPNPYLWRKPQVVRWYAEWKLKHNI
ncbi:MAG: respiratory nitrate reductase subunit gamma [Ignavibacteria bacterium]|nr:respiratory nitrate reductase subunit gamma [Ignavibacteria bacterium]